MAARDVITFGFSGNGAGRIATLGFGGDPSTAVVSARRSRYLQHVARLRFDIVTGKPIREPLTRREIENEILALFLAE